MSKLKYKFTIENIIIIRIVFKFSQLHYYQHKINCRHEAEGIVQFTQLIYHFFKLLHDIFYEK